MDRTEFEGHVLAYAHEHNLWQRGDAVLAAVSGGPDSLSLLLFLASVREKEKIRLGCCCVNHHIREVAADEADMVRRVCRELSVPCFVRDVDVPAYRNAYGGSLETVARELRYEALYDVMNREKYSLLALAHHKNDQAETVLYRLIRGSGSRGLSGMHPVRGSLIRPFLSVTRKEIAAYVAHFPYQPCHDETNDIPDGMRNKIRLQLLPLLETYNPNMVSALCRTAESCGIDDSFITQRAEEFFNAEAQKKNGEISVARHAFLKLHPAVARRVIRSISEALAGGVPDFDGTGRICRLIAEGNTGEVTSSAGLLAEISYDRAIFSRGSTRERKQPAQKTWILTQRIMETRPERLSKNEYLLDADKVGAIVLRSRKEGDRFAPFGMDGTRPVGRVMQSLHIPPKERDTWPLAADDRHIYWIGLLRGSRFGRPDEHTKRFLLLTLTGG